MKRTVAVVLCLLFVAAFAAAQETPNLFKTKCAACHGADGTADTPMGKKQNIKSFKAPEVQKMTDADLSAMIATGGPNKLATHQYGSKGLTPDQIKALVAYVKELGKK